MGEYPFQAEYFSARNIFGAEYFRTQIAAERCGFVFIRIVLRVSASAFPIQGVHGQHYAHADAQTAHHRFQREQADRDPPSAVRPAP